MAGERETESLARIDPPDLERRAFAMKHALSEEAWDLIADLVTATNIQRRMLVEGVPAHLTPSERKMGETIMRLSKERDDALARLRAADAGEG